MKVRRVGVETHVRIEVDGVATVRRPPHASDLAKRTQQTKLPVELVEEILLRVPPNVPAHLVRASLVCKAWHSILSDHGFLSRYHRFHRKPPLQGYFYNNSSDSTVQFVPTTSVAAASPLCTFKLDDSSGRKPWALDCRHGRVLIETHCSGSQRSRRLIVWDTITGSQHHLSMPTHPVYPYWHDYVGTVLCAKDSCDHLDCNGGPFFVVVVGMSHDNDDEEDGQTWASLYSSESGAWSFPTTPNDETNKYIDISKRGLLIGDALYFISSGYSIVKYDLRKHELSVMHLPEALPSILIKGKHGRLGVAAMLRTCIYMWSWRVSKKRVGRWVTYRVMDLNDTLLPKGDYLPDLICMVEGTNTVFIGVEHIGVFKLDLRTRQVSKIGETNTCYCRPILPYMSFSTPMF